MRVSVVLSNLFYFHKYGLQANVRFILIFVSMGAAASWGHVLANVKSFVWVVCVFFVMPVFCHDLTLSNSCFLKHRQLFFFNSVGKQLEKVKPKQTQCVITSAFKTESLNWNWKIQRKACFCMDDWL